MGSAKSAVVEKTEYDAVIIGAGFSGLYMLESLRSKGLRVRVLERGSDIGGVWYSSKYPGCRVDSEFYMYQFSSPKLYQDFDYKERFPSRGEVLRYFQHMDEKLELRKDVQFHSKVTSAIYHPDICKWEISFQVSQEEETISQIWAKYFIACTGFASKHHIPIFQGTEKFQGEIYHTSKWEGGEDENIENFQGKRIAVIGTGSSGVQVIQELGNKLNSEGQLTVYQRTPNLALPMKQCSLQDKNNRNGKLPKKEDFPEIYQKSRTTYAGIDYDSIDENTLDASPKERRDFYEKLFNRGGFPFWVGGYKDLLFSKEANATAYKFWAEKTRDRIHDERKKNILAPLIAPHAFGTKRPSLEQNYFEVFNKENVDIIDINVSPILELTRHGIKSEKEGVRHFDVIIFATGYDGITRGILDVKIENGNGQSIQDKWAKGTSTQLGLTSAGFPNFFFIYGPQAPTAFSNGPTCCEVQGEWLTKLIMKMEKDDKKEVDSLTDAEENWGRVVKDIWNSTLFPEVRSWYNGANVQGKPIEPLNYAGGIPNYIKALKECEEENYKGFIFA